MCILVSRTKSLSLSSGINLKMVELGVPTCIPMITKYHASLTPTLIRILQSGLPEFEDLSDEATSPTKSRSSASHFNSDEEHGTKDKATYADETKCNVCTLVENLIRGDVAFQARIAPELKTTLPVLLRHAKQLSASSGSMPNPITRTGSSSGEYAKPSTKVGQPTSKELQRQYLGRSSSIADVTTSLDNAATSLLNNIT